MKGLGLQELGRTAIILVGLAAMLLPGHGKTQQRESTSSRGELSFDDRVRSLTQTPEGQRVLFQTHAAVYWIPNSSSKARELTLKATAALKTQACVTLTVDPDMLVILEIVESPLRVSACRGDH